MVQNKHIYRGKKPVHWSPSSKTALAEAELEYPENHISRSIYVGFKTTELSPAIKSIINDNKNEVRVAIWTTTPWTIPANLAIAINDKLDYSLVYHPNYSNGAYFIVATDLIQSFGNKLGLQSDEALIIEGSMKGAELIGTKYQHPLYDRISDIVIGGDYITTDSGTGLVHTAPGHGQEDYFTGIKYNLPLLSPVDDAGRFTLEAGERFFGKDVLSDGNLAIITALNETGTLIKEEAYNHKYPYDWRTKKPTIFRATEQWFASISTFRTEALNAINKVNWFPNIGKNRITTMIESRGDWCISRQRSWGVPIPVFYKITTGEPLMTVETLKYIEDLIRKHGSDIWWELEVVDLLPTELRHLAHEYRKGTDTMDVWFDSGTSWAGVLNNNKEKLTYPADIYLEGSDQHRGWFQSSLLTSVATNNIAPYKNVITHGFVLDEKGFKMSKSLGNVVNPKSVIEGGSNQKLNPAYGADTLRLWVSSVDYSNDVCVGDNIMKSTSDSYRKIRNTLRFLVGSLNDFKPSTDAIAYDKLASIDKYMLGKLTEVVEEITIAYNEYQFYRVNQLLVTFCNIDLSSFYLDISKYRLYVASSNDLRRKSCQTVLNIMMEQLAVMLAPILPHLAEDLWQNFPYQPITKSVFQRGWIKPIEKYPIHEKTQWEWIKLLRNDINRCFEIARTAKLVGASQEGQILIYTSNPEHLKILQLLEGDNMILANSIKTNNIDDMRFIFIASQVKLALNDSDIINNTSYYLNSSDTESNVTLGVSKADGIKCERCWYYCTSVNSTSLTTTTSETKYDDLCNRCKEVIKIDKHLIENPSKN